MRHGHNYIQTEHDGWGNTRDRRVTRGKHVNKRRRQETKTLLKRMKRQGGVNIGAQGEFQKQ